MPGMHDSTPLNPATSGEQGGQQPGGVMPGSGDKANDQPILALIALLQSRWATEIYERWHNRHMQ